MNQVKVRYTRRINMDWDERVKAEYEEIIRKRDNTHRHSSWINDLQLNTITLNELPQVNCLEMEGDADNNASIVQRVFRDSVPQTFSWIPLTQNVFVEGEKGMDDVKDNSFMDDTIFFELVQALMEKYRNEMEQNTQTLPFPSPIIFEAINFNFPSKYTPQMLKEKYIQHQHQESLQSITSNINHNNTESVSHHSITNSEKYFCRRCLTYGCLLNHQREGRTRSNLKITEPEPCGSACFRHLEASGITVNSTMAGIQITSNTISAWTEEDHIYFRMVRRMYCNNSCLIAEAMRTINCKEVYEYAQNDGKLDIYEAFQDYTPPPDPLPNKRMIKFQWSKFHNKLPKIDSSGRFFNYKPCDHEGECNKDNPSCCCAQAPTFCEKFCKCSSTCKYRFMGCSCKATCKPNECTCARASRECDPDLCKSCGAHQIEPRKNSCKNVSLQRKIYKVLLVAPSQVAGWGLYLAESAKKDELISEYCGELISHAEADRREEIYGERKYSYLFTLDSKFVVDATSLGSEIRFVNHSEQPNIYAKVKMVAGDHHIGIFANRAIIKGEELFLDYHPSAKK